MSTAGKVSRGFPEGFYTEQVLVTPQMARELLATMHPNRSRSRLEVGVQEANLREDSWWPEISPVFMDADPGSPAAYDAQHRFQAVVNTGISAWMLFIYGVREEAALYIDTGRKRTYADMLRIDQVPDYKRQSVLAKYIAGYSAFGIEFVRNPGRFPVSQAAKNRHLNTPALMGAIHAGEAMYRAIGANPSWTAYAAWRTGELAEDGENWTPSPFWEMVRSGAELDKDHPALALFRWYGNGVRARDRRTPSDKRLMELYALTTAYNKFVAGQPYQRVNPVFERKPSGQQYFPAANVPDFLPADIGALTRSQLRTAYENMERGAAPAARLLRRLGTAEGKGGGEQPGAEVTAPQPEPAGPVPSLAAKFSHLEQLKAAHGGRG